MRILIDHNSLGRYKFYTENEKKPLYYVDNGYMIFKGDYAKIYTTEGEKIMDLRQGKSSAWTLTKSTYSINDRKNGRMIEVNCKNYKRGHWAVDLNQNNYEIFFHGREKKSLFKNGEQVAKFGKTNSGHCIISNSDEDVLFLIALFMTFKMGDSAPDDDLILENYDDEREQNSKWQPSR